MSRAMVKDQEKGFLYNCIIKSRDGDEGLFNAIENRVIACLDGYLIAPIEEYQEFIKWKERRSKSKIRVLNVGGK